MRWRDGTGRQKVVYTALVALYAIGVLLAAADKLQRIGRPDVGFVMDGSRSRRRGATRRTSGCAAARACSR